MHGRSSDDSASLLLSLLGLATLAIAQPLLELIGRNVAFLVAHDVGPMGLMLLTAALTFGLPLALTVVVVGVRQVSRPASRALQGVVLTLLVAAAILRMARVAAPAVPASLVLPLVLAVAVGAAVAYSRLPNVRRTLRFSAVAAPAAALLFLFATPARGLLTAEPNEASRAVAGEAPPIVIVIFDELPLSSLLDADRTIDEKSFPAFAELAAGSTLFRNATTTHASTVEAVPSLLSGRYSRINRLPNAASHPTNIFSVLGGSYQPHALEPLTDLCGTMCRDDDEPGDAAGVFPLVRDLAVLQMHLVTPADMATALPPLDQGLRDFGGGGFQAGLDREEFLGEAADALSQDIPSHFRTFVREIRPATEPTLHVLHTLLPHRPWVHLPDGRRHGGRFEPATPDGIWVNRAWPRGQALQLHLAQTQLADRLLGQLVRRLERVGIYDEALLVVAADHGVSMLPGEGPRVVTTQSLPGIAHVPLLLKLPGQERGAVVDDPVQTIDILPTILDRLGVESPPDLDGAPLLRRSATTPERKLIDQRDTTWHVDVTPASADEAIARKLNLFGRDLYSLAPPRGRHLLGRRVPANIAQAPQTHVEIANAEAYTKVRPSSRFVPALVTGTVESSAGPGTPMLAIAVNGRIEAVTLADIGRPPEGAFRALVDPAVLQPGANDVEVLLVGSDGGLRRIPRR